MYLLSNQPILFDSNNESGCAFFFDLHREWLGEFGGTVNRFYVYCIQSNWDVSIIRSLEKKETRSEFNSKTSLTSISNKSNELKKKINSWLKNWQTDLLTDRMTNCLAGWLTG